jgi:hypothetical protein
MFSPGIRKGGKGALLVILILRNAMVSGVTGHPKQTQAMPYISGNKD